MIWASRFDDASAACFLLRCSPPFSPGQLGGPPRWSLSPRPGKQTCGRLVCLKELFVGMRLYVGNLAYSVTSQSLEQLFSEFGQVKDATVVQDRDTGRSKGFGFVEMNDNGQAQAAIQALNLKEVDGRCLTVNEARPREERGGRGGGGGGGGRGYGGGGGGGGYGGGGGGRRY